jgi:hypothetical protein
MWMSMVAVVCCEISSFAGAHASLSVTTPLSGHRCNTCSAGLLLWSADSSAATDDVVADNDVAAALFPAAAGRSGGGQGQPRRQQPQGQQQQQQQHRVQIKKSFNLASILDGLKEPLLPVGVCILGRGLLQVDAFTCFLDYMNTIFVLGEAGPMEGKCCTIRAAFPAVVNGFVFVASILDGVKEPLLPVGVSKTTSTYVCCVRLKALPRNVSWLCWLEQA